MLTMSQLLQLYAIVSTHKARIPGREKLLAALDDLIDNYPRPASTEEPS